MLIDETYVPYIKIVPPITTPVTVEQLKQQLRQPSMPNTQNAQLLSFIQAATAYAEKATNRIMINTGFRTFRNYVFPPYILLKRSKYQSLQSFEYVSSGVFTTVPSDLYYITDETDYSAIMLYPGQTWPSPVDCQAQSIRIDFTAGYGTKPEDVPADIRQAILQHATALWSSRGDCNCTTESALPPSAADIYQSNRIIDMTGLNVSSWG